MKTLCAVLIGLVIGVAFAPPATAASLKDRLPADAYGYMAVNDVPDLLAKVRASYIYGQIVESGALDNMGLIPGFGQMRDIWSTYVEPLGDILDGELVFALLPADDERDTPGVVFMLQVNEELLSVYLKDALYPLVEDELGEIEELDHKGLKIARVPLDPRDDDEVMFLCVKDDLAVAGQRLDDVERLVRDTLGGGLTTSRGYTEFRRVVGETDAEFFVNLPAVLRDATEDDEEAKAGVERMGFHHVRSVGWGTRLDEDGSLGTLRIATDAPPGSIAALFGRATGDPKSLRYVPEDAAFYASLRFGSLLELYRATLTIAQQATGETEPPPIPGLDEIEHLLGMDLEQEILPAFGGELAAAAWLASGATMPSGAVALEVRDKATVEKLIKEVLVLIEDTAGDELEVSPDIYDGVKITTAEVSEMVAPSCAIVGDFLVVGINPDAVETVIDVFTDQSGLDKSAACRRAISRVGGSGGFTSYMDFNTLGVLFARIWFTHALGMPGDFGADELGLGDEPLPRAGALRVDAAGVTYRTYSRVEFVHASVPIMAGMLLPALARGRVEAARALSMNNANQLARAVFQYSLAYDDVLPEKLSDLVEVGILPRDPELFVHPRGTDPNLIDFDKPETVDEYSDYELVLKGVRYDEIDDPATTVLLREKRQFREGGRVVVYLDGHAEFVEEEPEEDEEIVQ